MVSDWSSITGSGATKREGGGGGEGASEVLPQRKGNLEKVLAMLKGDGAQKVLG